MVKSQQMSQLSHAQLSFAGIPISSSTIDGRGVPRLLIRGERVNRRARAEAQAWNPYLTWIEDGLLRHAGGHRSMVQGERP
jgi:hypothetical protein